MVALVRSAPFASLTAADQKTFAAWLDRVGAGYPGEERAALASALAAARDALNGGGRVLLRPSGTEPVLRVMVEAREADTADRCARQLADVVAKAAA